jgi:hypothetical protein
MKSQSLLIALILILGVLNTPLSVGAQYDFADPQKALEGLKNALPSIDIQLPSESPAVPSQINSEALSGLTNGLNGSLGDMWGSLDSWVFEKIGISIGEILQTIINFIIWMFELAIKILQAIIGILP